MTALTRRYHFAASHRLHSARLTAEENAALYGKCNHPFGHGHDYTLEVTVEGEPDAATGMIVPRAKLDALVEKDILRLFASRNINVDVPYFADLVPTTENIVRVIAQILRESWDESAGTFIRRIYVRETGRNSFELSLPRHAGILSEKAIVHAETQSF
jgi:6-pyruvoyltetrahydropterin/6-carboxytetrahydropterin synthase